MEELKCFSGGTVIDPLVSTTKYDAIDELIHKAPIFRSKVEDIDDLEKAVIARERFQSTGFGHGIAVTHGKSEKMETIYIALGISRDGLDFEAYDGKPVNLLFLVASPPRLQQEYLQALAVLTSLFHDGPFRSELLQQKDTKEMEAMLKREFGVHYRQRKRETESPRGALVGSHSSEKSKVAK